jgi:hypothetical protein
MSWQIQESVNVGDCDLLWAIANFHDVIAGTNFSFLQYSKVEAWPTMCDQQSRHARLVHADANAVAGYARLGHFEYCITDTVPITDANLAIGKTFNGEVFAELAKTEIVAPKKARPVTV